MSSDVRRWLVVAVLFVEASAAGGERAGAAP